MMYYLESPGTDPHFNLALEQYVFDRLDPAHAYFMLWQNDNAIIVGKHQNTAAEIDAAYVKAHGIRVVRRLSGGGAVYHDLGNVNYTFIVDADGSAAFDFASFCRPIVLALESLGVRAKINGRNDITIDGKKFSGNAQYLKRGRVMHHGTILFDSDLEAVARALTVSRDKLESKGLKSVHSRVTNVKPYVQGEVTTSDFLSLLREYMIREYGLVRRPFREEELEAVRRLQAEVYDQWSWNYGASPAYRVRKERRVEGCGRLEVFMDVEAGRIRGLAFYGDYFGNGDSAELAARLAGCPLEEEALRRALEGLRLDDYFNRMDLRSFLDTLLC